MCGPAGLNDEKKHYICHINTDNITVMFFHQVTEKLMIFYSYSYGINVVKIVYISTYLPT